MNNKKYLGMLILYVVVGIISVTGVTLAVTYNMANMNASITTATIDATFIGSTTVSASDLFPITAEEVSTLASTATFSVKGVQNNPSNVYYDVILKDIIMSSNMKNSDVKWELIDGNGVTVDTGHFGLGCNSMILTPTIRKLRSSTETADSYTFRFYILETSEDQTDLMDGTFSAVLDVVLYGSKTGTGNRTRNNECNANAPVLASGMIPIRYNDENMKWEKANSTNTTNNWYDYNTKRWANAVMVASGTNNATRDYYKNAPVGTEILESDVLGYFVWIPRYRYQIFNVESNSISPQQITVDFQGITDDVDTGTTNGAWLTHPAFWWDEDNDGVREAEEELSGIWVGKFETSTTESTCYSSPSTANCNNENQMPVIKPNRMSLRNQAVSKQYTTARKINTTNYLDEINQIDAHMMKNMEWGAVAYLTQSQYGRCESETCSEIYINNSESFYTGRSGGNVGESVTTTVNGTYSYDGYTCTDANCTSGIRNATTKEAGYNASTNGNITGVYDMSGGAFEYVMGVQLNDGNNSINYRNSAFTTSTLPFLENTIGGNYVDYYTYGTSSSDYTRRKLGDATGEARGWYSDYQSFVYASGPWFRRGGYYINGAGAGIFASYYGNGSAYGEISFRVVLTPLI